MFLGSVNQVTLVPEVIHLSKEIRDWKCVERPISTPAATPEVTGSRPTVSWRENSSGYLSIKTASLSHKWGAYSLGPRYTDMPGTGFPHEKIHEGC